MNQLDDRARESAAGLLFSALRSTAAASRFSDSDWDLFLRVARSEGLLARIAIKLEQEAALDRVPMAALDQLNAASSIAADHARMIRWEIDRIQFALANLNIPMILLKGAAYLMANLPLANGRLVSDVDILLQEDSLLHAEAALLASGWQHLKLDPYDQKYYRRWMHELPPLRHQSRGTIVDVHHRILPLTSRLNLKPDKLWSASIGLADSKLRVLSREDMLLHCAIHLFHDGDLNHGLRDLVDLHDMFDDFGHKPGYWYKLISRAQELGVARPLFYAMRYSTKLLGTQIPSEAHAAIEASAPVWLIKKIMDKLVCRVLSPEHPDYPGAEMAMARWLLFVRSHYLRMPLMLLIPHLLRKSFKRRTQSA